MDEKKPKDSSDYFLFEVSFQIKFIRNVEVADFTPNSTFINSSRLYIL